MQGYRAVEIGLAGAHADGDADELDHFCGSWTQKMNAEHLALILLGDELDDHPLGAVRKRVLHGAEARDIDIDITMGRSLGFRQTDGTDLRLGKDRSRD